MTVKRLFKRFAGWFSEGAAVALGADGHRMH